MIRVVLIATGILVVWLAAIIVNRRRVRRYDGSGDSQDAIVVFVEPVRWLFIIWGFSGFCRGLRQAGGRQLLRLFLWSSVAGAMLVIPDLIRRRRLERRARRLARFLDRLAVEHPRAVIHMVGYSSGCYLALEAAKRVTHPRRIGRIVLLAASVSPSYVWDELAEWALAIHSFHSRLDVINIVGPLLFGSNDRRWGPSCGAVGFRCPPPIVSERSWIPSDVRLGYLGDHFTIASSAFVATHVAPLLAVHTSLQPAFGGGGPRTGLQKAQKNRPRGETAAGA
ncbi:MAG: hypothetical protein JXB13_17485 [Phycisphaerae bacterium]|nr:hypothetical protein [Phycisphaerae bacterium]